MAAVIDDYMDSPMDQDDVFPCKGCGDILEEGKAFELAGNRWHLDCFRCNTCNTLLDSDANLLLLGDGSLICNNCTYSCSACGNKIEELAILTGEQAFCATCFRCRNCKRKIENLRYARTSQGIFCMSCHESVMARRRKKHKQSSQPKPRDKESSSPMITDKSLPALPPSAIPPNAFSDTRVDPDSDTPTELSPRPRGAYRNDSSSRTSSRPERSPERPSNNSGREDGRPQPGRRNTRSSTVTSSNNAESGGGADDAFFIPVALDPTPASNSTPRSASDNLVDASKRKDRDYFNQSVSSLEKRSDSQGSTPHIAFQERGRQHSSSSLEQTKLPSRKPSDTAAHSTRHEIQPFHKPSPSTADDRTLRTIPNNKQPPGMDDFKLQDAPKTKKAANMRAAQSPNLQSDDASSGKGSIGFNRKEKDALSPVANSESPARSTPRSSQDSRPKDDDEGASANEQHHGIPRTDSLPSKSIARKEVPKAPRSNPSQPGSGAVSRSNTDEVTSAASGSASRPAQAEQQKQTDPYMQPRAPPQPPGAAGPGQQQGREAAAPGQEGKDGKHSPKLPRWSSGGDFTMDEDMARILGTDEGSSSILRRVSNVVRHGRTNSTESGHGHHHHHGRQGGHTRSVSETTRGTSSPRWPKTPVVPEDSQGHDISSPISLHGSDDPAFLKRQLRNSENRVAELERHFTTEKDIKHLNKKLLEKRKTVSTLDTQTEIMIRQLEVLAGYVEKAKETKTPVDPRDLEDSAIKEFVQKLDKLKFHMSESIEQLHAERDELVEEKNRAVADRDRALLEFEQLSSKNAQLADMNNDLTHQIQERFKSQIGDLKSPNNAPGLGIYSQPKSFGGSSSNLADAASVTTATTLLAAEGEEPVVEAKPMVVDIRKGQAKKFNWKKGSRTMAQNIAKGVNRTVGAFQQEREGRHPALGGDNIGMPYNTTVTQVESPVSAGLNGQHRHHPQHGPQQQQQQQYQYAGQQQQAHEARFPFFKKNNNTVAKSSSANNLAMPSVAEAPSSLFGSELTDRADYERRTIPSVVTRCIEEVELRGMDVEGIYRKTGGNSSVKMVQEGFDKSDDFDISDPELDITAVTSVLKQYFRKLPTPLLTFEIYDRILESNAVADTAERCDFLRKTFASMPQRHQDCLEFLMFHLARVAQREPENLMSPKNLSVVFAPTIMRDTSLEREMTDMHAKNLAVQFVIEHSTVIFTE